MECKNKLEAAFSFLDICLYQAQMNVDYYKQNSSNVSLQIPKISIECYLECNTEPRSSHTTIFLKLQTTFHLQQKKKKTKHHSSQHTQQNMCSFASGAKHGRYLHVCLHRQSAFS